MAEIQPTRVLRCHGCPRVFDDPEDLAPARIGTDLVQLCRRCYFTALGPDNKVTFEVAQELGLS